MAQPGDTGPPQPYQLMIAIAERVAGKVGDAFLQGLVTTLHGFMRADFVMLTAGQGDPPTRARSIYARDRGAPVEESYDLAQTPCLRVYSGEELVISSDLERLYPVEHGYDSYAAVPIRIGGRVSGHLAVLSARPIADPDTTLGILRIFGLRCEAELQRLAAEAERERLIDDLTALADRLRNAHLAAREESAFKTRLLGIIAHDLRNPLAAILGQAELARTLLGKDAGPDRIDRALGKIAKNADGMSGLIDATLDRVREDATSLSLSRMPVDLSALLRTAAEFSAAAAGAKSIAIDISAPEAVMAEIDEALLLRAVDNLIGNAVKYTHPGGRIFARLDADGRTVRITVRDTGQGLTTGDLARVFGRFQTLSARPTGGETSTGLGLANVREIVEAHGGTITAESPGRDRGATFTIRLPV